MAKTDNLIDYLTDIADAIREKKGTSDLINAQNFADEIKNMPQGGEGESSGTGRDIEYFSVTENESAGELIFLMSLVKLDYSGNISILTSAGYIDVTDSNRANLIAIGIDMTLPIVMGGVKTTPREWFESNGLSDLSIFGWTPITEEEFYNLNA